MSDLQQRLAQWQALQAMSDELQRLLDNEDWEAFAEVQRQRQQGLEAFFAEPLEAELHEQVRTELQAMLDADRALMERVAEARQQTKEQLLKLGRGRQQVKQYQQRY